MSINIGIQLTDLQPSDNNSTQNKNIRNPADFYSSPPEPILVEPGDQIITKACFLNLRQQNNGNIIVPEDITLTFKFYHYYIPQLISGIDTGTSSDGAYVGLDAPISNQGKPYILMCRKDYYQQLLQSLQNASPSNPPQAPPLNLFEQNKCYLQSNYGTVWTWNDFVPMEFYYNVPLKAGSYSPSYLAQYITTKINSQPNGTSNNNWQSQPPTFPPNQTPIKSVYYNPNYANNIQWGPGVGTGFAYEWFGGTQSNNPFYYNLFMVQNVEFYNAWYNANGQNRKTYVYLWKNLQDDTFFHNSDFMFSGTSQMSLEFNDNNSGLFSFNMHMPVINDNNISVCYQGFKQEYTPEPVPIYYGWLFTKMGGIMFSDLQPQSFWQQLGFDDSIKATFDDTSGQYRMTPNLFNQITSDTYCTINQINANSTYLQSQQPIDENDNNKLFFASQDFTQVFAKNTFISNIDDSGHYLLELSAYSSKFATNTTYQAIKMILPTYYTNVGSSYIYINQISGFPSSYTHFGEPFLLGYMRCRVLTPRLNVAQLSTGNYVYLEVIKPLKNIVQSIKDNKDDEKQQEQLYA